MSLKDNYLELIKKFNKSPEKPAKPYILTKKGVPRSIIKSILQGSDVGIHNVYIVAKALNVPMEALYPGIEQTEKVMDPAEGYADNLAVQYSFLGKFGLLSEEEKELIEKTMEVFRGTNRDNVVALKSNIRAFRKSRNYEEEEDVLGQKKRRTGAG